MGPPTDHLSRIALHLCVDAIPAHNKINWESVKPIQSIILSLPPWLRYKVKHMLVHMVIPAHLKGQEAKKYYDWSAAYEMNDLQLRGVGGVRVLLYGTTLDTPGRRELLSMQSCTAFYHCPHCLNTAQPGLRKQVHGGFRQFLPRGSRWRERQFVYKGHRYMFRAVERRTPPATRTDRSVAILIARATRRKPFFGHKSDPFLYNWIGFRWDGETCDVMHDYKGVCLMILLCLVGKGSDTKYKDWGSKKRDSQHRDDCEAYDIFEDVHDGTTRFPWRLSKDDVKEQDRIVRSMWWPHYVDKLYKGRHSFWTHTDRMKKSIHKYYILTVLLPTCLHGFVPAVHTAILMMVYALRRLDGQVLSKAEAVYQGVEPGSRVIKKTSVTRLREILIRGLVLLEGSFPLATLKPVLHHLVHHPRQVMRMGILGWFAMWAFERNNKKIKDMVRNPRHTLASLAKSLRVNIASRYTCLSEESESKIKNTTCYLMERSKNNGFYLLSEREMFDLEILGADTSNVRSYNIARILGCHFRAGEWGRRRCGSVITTIYGGRSRYCYVKTFLRVGGKDFARVQWLSIPEYPCSPNRLVVTVRMLSPEQQRRHRSVISIDMIDPCTVAVIPNTDGIHFSMMRDRGYDRVRVCYFGRAI